MDRPIRTQPDDWRDRLMWTSLSLCLLAFLLLGLVLLADWVDRNAAPSLRNRAVMVTAPTTGGVVADLFAPPLSWTAPVSTAAVSAAASDFDFDRRRPLH
jgi:hypothetical protein